MPILNCDWSSALLILSTDEYRLCDIKNCPNLTHPYKIVTLASSSTRIWWLRNTLMASSVVASINYGPSADHWCSMLHMYWYRHSFTGESTTATPSSMESATGLSESCNQYCMLVTVVWWLVSVRTSISRRPFVMCFTGYQSSSGSHTRLQRWRSVVFVVRARRISLTSVRQFRQLPDVPSYALHTMVTSLFRLRNRRHFGSHSALLRLLSGTVYQLSFSTST